MLRAEAYWISRSRLLPCDPLARCIQHSMCGLFDIAQSTLSPSYSRLRRDPHDFVIGKKHEPTHPPQWSTGGSHGALGFFGSLMQAANILLTNSVSGNGMQEHKTG